MSPVFSTARLKEFFTKYGKVGLGVHFSVSAVSITGFYVAIKNNVDVEGLIERVGLHVGRQRDSNTEASQATGKEDLDATVGTPKTRILPDSEEGKEANEKTPSRDLLLSGGGALALAILCNKALLPVRLPLTFALTPPIARFLARRKLYREVD